MSLVNIDDYRFLRRRTVLIQLRFNGLVKEAYYVRLFDLTTEDTTTMILFDIICEGWCFHDWINYECDLSHRSLIYLSIIKNATFIDR